MLFINVPYTAQHVLNECRAVFVVVGCAKCFFKQKTIFSKSEMFFCSMAARYDLKFFFYFIICKS